MKNKVFLYVAMIATMFACKSNDDVTAPESKIHEGETVTININIAESDQSASPARTIYGGSVSGQVPIKWSWAKKGSTIEEKIAVEWYDPENPSVQREEGNGRSIFTLTKVDADNASFTGEIPEGKGPNDKLRVIGGNYTDYLPVGSDGDPIIVAATGIADNEMRFEANNLDDLDGTLTLQAVWSAFYIPINIKVTQSAASVAEDDEISGPSFKCVVDAVELWNGATRTYKYQLGHKLSAEVTATQEVKAGKTLLFIAAPGTYDNISFRVYMSMSSDSEVDPDAGTHGRVLPSYFSCDFSATAGSPTLSANYYHPFPDIDCEIEFQAKEEE